MNNFLKLIWAIVGEWIVGMRSIKARGLVLGGGGHVELFQANMAAAWMGCHCWVVVTWQVLCLPSSLLIVTCSGQ